MQISGNQQVTQLLAAQTSAQQTSQQVQFSVARKQLDAQKQSGDAVLQLLQQAVAVSKQTSAFGKLDVHA